MICKYSKCNEEAGKNRAGRDKNYCDNEHRKLGRSEIKQEGFKSTLYLTDQEMEDIIESRRLIKTALKGNVESQEALMETGLKGHYRRGIGGWGELTYEGGLE